jgi:hypothetical protein
MFTRKGEIFIADQKLEINSFFFEKGNWGFSAVANGKLEFFQLCADGQSIRHVSTINELVEITGNSRPFAVSGSSTERRNRAGRE